MINKYFIVHKEEKLNSIVEKILINGHRAVIVIEKNKVLGSISEGDILKSIMYKKSVNTTALNLMNKSFKFLTKKDDDKIKKDVYKPSRYTNTNSKYKYDFKGSGNT